MGIRHKDPTQKKNLKKLCWKLQSLQGESKIILKPS